MSTTDPQQAKNTADGKAAPRVVAPWSDKEVEVLNRYQQSGRYHPYTCGFVTAHQPLYPTTRGWRCWDCQYSQHWALLSTFTVMGFEAVERWA